MPDDDRLEAISEALAQVLRRQGEIEQRLTRIESAMRIAPVEQHPEPHPPPLPVQPPVAEPPPFSEPPPVPVQPPPFPRGDAILPPPVPAAAAGMETRIGLNWLNIIGVVTLLIGAAFFFKYATDNNWIGPGARIIMGIVVALGALVFGDRMWTKGQKNFGQGITGLGLALLYVTFWAAYGLYQLIPQPAAFLLMVLTTAAAVVFAMRYESRVIAVIGIVAGYWTPGALSGGDPHPWILFGYVLLLNVACMVLTRLRAWAVLEYIAGAATILWYGAWMVASFHPSHPDDVFVAMVFAFAFYVQFCFTRFRWLWAAAQLLGPIAVFNIFNDPDQLLPLLFLFALGGLIVAEIRRWDVAPSWTLTCYWVVCGFSKGSTPEMRFAYITGTFVLFFLWVLWWGLIRHRVLRNTDLLVMVANAAAYFGASYFLLNPHYHAYMGLLAAALAGLHLLLARLVWIERSAALLAVAVTVTFLTLAIPIQFGGFRITMAWALEGAALAWLSTRFESTKMSIGSSIILILATVRLFMFDSLTPDNRFLTFAVTAAALFLASRFFEDRAQAALAYIAGHFVALVALALQLTDWVHNSVAKPDQFQTSTLLISVLMAVYAVFLITLGVATRTALNRIMGLVLMALVVLKLYMSDVWQLGNLFKIVAFLGLSVLLLSVSYLYSRFRPTIEKLWKDDPSS